MSEYEWKRQQADDHYDAMSYAYSDHRRWASYRVQMAEVLLLRPRTALVIGHGDGIIPALLRHAGIDVVSVDADADLGPNVVADVRELPLEDAAFEVTLCCQVLEHLPRNLFPSVLAELRRVSVGHLILSLPQSGRMWEVALRLPTYRELRVHRSGVLQAKPHTGVDRNDMGHYWEIAPNFPCSDVVRDIESRYGPLVKEFTVVENPYHRFFVARAV